VIRYSDKRITLHVFGIKKCLNVFAALINFRSQDPSHHLYIFYCIFFETMSNKLLILLLLLLLLQCYELNSKTMVSVISDCKFYRKILPVGIMLACKLV